MNFALNQIFDKTYPPEAALFCNQYGYVIKEIAPEDGKRRFQIQEVPAPTEAEAFAALRSERGRRLAETDYMLMPDYPIDADKLDAVKAYRQVLRDLPQQEGAPWVDGDIPWPKITK